ncbi:immunoglobulin-like domain-containing protein [Jeotgalibaca caeni]|uniref:immunoglobulin-like domain-containing protein n=1 Tax=Jeotgalibaca caeni TaxID=3028623 RepID=UPI00237DA4E0|nr:immunoglobulin-like domain-containing protein [Jeotgalibaca caeni]MDE1549141.1 hypothetical protein [Jeotgalibaca caeni]
MTMKKMLLFVLTAGISMGVLAGCSGSDGEPSPYEESEVNQLEGVSMETTEATYPVEAEGVNVRIKNETDEEYYYGVAYSVERLVNDTWVVVPFEGEVSWIEIAITLAPQSENEEGVSFDLLESDREPGTYRIIKEVANHVVAAEFELVETE